MVAAAILAAALGFGALRPQETLENDVKAAFLYNFTKFIEWPDAAARSAEPFRLCVLADPDFVRAVDRIIEGESVQGRPLRRVEPHTPEDARTCAILFIGSGNSERGARLLPAIRHFPVLTVGDFAGFVEQGGAIGFVRENNRVRFDVSPPSAERSGLKVSSKLLRVARHVVEGGAR